MNFIFYLLILWYSKVIYFVITIRAIAKLNLGHIDKFKIKIYKIGHRGSHSPDNVELDHFMLGVFHLQKIWKISSVNFCLGRARSICHKFHLREPREAWPLKRP